MQVLPGIEVELPVVAAPMAGGPGTPELVLAAAGAGGLGFVAAGYLSAATLADRVGAVRVAAPQFGVNLFAPNPQPVDRAEFRRYAGLLAGEAARYGLDLSSAEPVEDDDDWSAKVDLLVRDPVPVVSFTFGIPSPSVVSSLQAQGTVAVQTVTSVDEALAAVSAGVDALVVQSASAGGHLGTLSPGTPPPDLPLPDLVRAVLAAVSLPVVAAGGIGTTDDVAAVLATGASAALVGTALLRTPESAAAPAYRAALADPARGTVVTRAFTGRPARGLRNRFTDAFTALAPAGYPAINHLTGPLRKAAAAAGDPELVNLWAGTGYRHAAEEPAADLLRRLASGL